PRFQQRRRRRQLLTRRNHDPKIKTSMSPTTPNMSTTKSELRFTDTNAASDSKGRTWGLEGGLFWWLIAGIGAGIIIFFVLLVVLDVSLAMSFVAALVP